MKTTGQLNQELSCYIKDCLDPHNDFLACIFGKVALILTSNAVAWARASADAEAARLC